MSKRLQFQEILSGIDGVKAAYFQPPPTVKMQYPAIIYSISRPSTSYANNELYRYKQAYTVTVVDRNPDSLIPVEIAKMQYSSFDRAYTADLLNHFVYTVYY